MREEKLATGNNTVSGEGIWKAYHPPENRKLLGFQNKNFCTPDLGGRSPTKGILQKTEPDNKERGRTRGRGGVSFMTVLGRVFDTQKKGTECPSYSRSPG